MNETIETEPPTALAIIPTTRMPTLLAADTKDILGKLRAELRGYVPDASSPEGREKIGSMKRKVGIAKADFDRLRIAEAMGARRTIEAINAEWKIIEANLDTIQEQIEAPRVAYQAAEKARVTANEDAIAAIECLTDGLADLSSDDIKARFESIVDFDWSVEFRTRAEKVRAGVVAQLQIAHQAAKVREAEVAAEAARQAEAAEFERLALERTRQLREAEIARQAAEDARLAAEAEAEHLRVEAEERAAAQLAAAEALRKHQEEVAARKAREAEAELARIEAERIAGVERERAAAEKAEVDRIEGHERALAYVGSMFRDAVSPINSSREIQHITKIIDSMAEMSRQWEEYADQFTDLIAEGHKQIEERLATVLANEEERRKQLEAERAQQAEEQRLAAEAEATRRQETAIEAERQRVAEEAAKQKAEDDRRAADKAHRGKIDREALAAILLVMRDREDITPEIKSDLSRKIVEAIARGEIRHVGIKY